MIGREFVQLFIYQVVGVATGGILLGGDAADLERIGWAGVATGHEARGVTTQLILASGERAAIGKAGKQDRRLHVIWCELHADLLQVLLHQRLHISTQRVTGGGGVLERELHVLAIALASPYAIGTGLVASLIQQLLGLLWVKRVGLEVGVFPRRNRPQRCDDARLAEQQLIGDGEAVNAVDQSLAHFLVFENAGANWATDCIARAEVEEVMLERRAGRGKCVHRVFDAFEVGDRAFDEVGADINIARTQTRQHRIAALHDLDVDGVQLGLAAPIVWVGGQRQVIAFHHFFDGERAGERASAFGHKVAAIESLQVLECVLGQQAACAGQEQCTPRCEHIFERDHGGLRIRCVNLLDLVVTGLAGDAGVGGVHDLLPGELKVRAGNRLAVAPFQIFLEFVGDGLAIFADGIFVYRGELCGQLQNGRALLVVVPHTHGGQVA